MRSPVRAEPNLAVAHAARATRLWRMTWCSVEISADRRLAPLHPALPRAASRSRHGGSTRISRATPTSCCCSCLRSLTL